MSLLTISVLNSHDLNTDKYNIFYVADILVK